MEVQAEWDSGFKFLNPRVGNTEVSGKFNEFSGYSKKLKFLSCTLVTQGIFVMTLLDNLSQKYAQKKHIFPSLMAKSFYKGIRSKIQRRNCFFNILDLFSNFLSCEWFKVLGSICLIDTVLLIPILTYSMTFYAIWHMS